jgi:hypothetical protein
VPATAQMTAIALTRSRVSQFPFAKLFNVPPPGDGYRSKIEPLQELHRNPCPPLNATYIAHEINISAAFTGPRGALERGT